VVRNAGHWLWEGTGLREGEPIAGLVAGEADHYHPRIPLPEYTERILLAHSPYQDTAGLRGHQDTSLYRAPSGAWVFASGTFAWSPALDRPGHTDARIQRATANLLDAIGKGAPPWGGAESASAPRERLDGGGAEPAEWCQQRKEP
jgi:hypothetical protein